MKISPPLSLVALLVLAFTLAVGLAPEAAAWSQRDKAGNVLGMMFGDGRKLLANQFFTMADVYFHSGYYPTIFDAKTGKEGEPKAIVAASRGHESHEGHHHEDGKEKCEECEQCESFLGAPLDWIDAFGRNFKITKHTHLEHGTEREILPWLRLAADLDPQKIETYTVGAFFLREQLHRPDQAEAFLREGLRNNPANYLGRCELSFELGRIYYEGLHDSARARNVWEAAVNMFILKLNNDEQKENKLVFEELVVNLATLEEAAGNYGQAITWFQAAQKVSPIPATLQERIDKLQKKLNALVPVAPGKLF